MTAWSCARRRRIRSVVGVFAGAAMVRLAAVYVSDHHTSRGSYVFVAGAATAVLAAATLVDEVRRARRAPRSGPRHTAAMLAWLLTIPLGAALAIAPIARTAPTAQSGPTAPGPQAAGLAPETPTRPSPMVYPRLPDGDPVRMSVADYVTRVRSDIGASLAGRQVELTGYLGSAPDGGLDLRRTVISCCSKRPETFAVHLVGALPPGAGPGTWLRVTGRLPARGIAAARTARIAYLSVTAATVVSGATGPEW
jgi:hypothetical protein